MLNKTILIIDDHKKFREILRIYIENEFKDLKIKEAGTGEEGVQVAIRERPNISLVDVRLPGIDGIETARQIRECVPGCEIITMSMFQQSSFQELVDQKAMVFVNKSKIDSELIPLLYKFLNGIKSKKGVHDEI